MRVPVAAALVVLLSNPNDGQARPATRGASPAGEPTHGGGDRSHGAEQGTRSDRERPPWLDPNAAPPDAAELRYLIDPETGAVLMAVPPEILQSVLFQLTTRGHEAEARRLLVLYDRSTGRVRDPEHARYAEARIRGPNAPPISPPTGQPGNPPPSPPAVPESTSGQAPGAIGGAR
jgi:hypothetical protein